ncbi:hypothetical protein QUA07_01530 [Microcoleus sp. T3_A4]|uniref:hypothetical protein n=1 Tax=Microcoleus sp. T3_A4 TaxID=2818968 RepID=UPI002FCF3C15
MKEEGRRKKEEGRRKKEEGRRKEEGRKPFDYAQGTNSIIMTDEDLSQVAQK